ncbi:MAG: hypothetical protein H0U31_08960 [Chloroflexia bacterium]|nr:hypothetical protein [Chloroflexia bacterium]
MPAAAPSSPLDGRLDVGRLGWFGVFTAVAAAIAFCLRFAQLDAYVLSQREGAWAYSAWSLYTGKPLPAGQELPDISPLFLLLQSGIYFLFGVTDPIARALPALTGFGIVVLILAFRPFLPRTAIVGMALLAAISPTLVFASRTIDPAILIAFFALLAVASVLRAGHAHEGGSSFWPGVFGGAVAAAIASGPEGVTAILAIGIAMAVGGLTDSRQDPNHRPGPVAAGVRATFGTPSAFATAVASFVVVSILAFSRLLSNASSLEGFLTTFSDWGRMMATQTSTTPTQFFFYATVLYEILAMVLAVVAISTTSRSMSAEGSTQTLRPTIFVVWFVAALVLQSLASGRQPDQTVLVILPLVLLGGYGLGNLFERIPWRNLAMSRDGLILAAMGGLFFGVVGVIVLAARANDPAQADFSPWLRALFVLVVVVVPLAWLVYRESAASPHPRHAGWCALLIVTLLLGVFTIRSATQVAFERADSGSELLAQRVPTDGVGAFVDQTLRLSRDLSLAEVSNIDNTGSFGISIAIDPSIAWPYAWYFRDFPDIRVTSPAGWDDADLVIAPTREGMEDAGYVVQTRSWMNRVPAAYEDLGLDTVFSTIFSPSKWYDAYRYFMYRELAAAPTQDQISVGYTFRLSNQMNPSAGPFDLGTGQSLGPGAALGQLNAPTGIALSSDGEIIYVVDSGNQRIQRFARDGTFIGTWSAEDDQRLGLGMFEPANQGASDIFIGPDDLIYVADTWNHRIMILDSEGQLVRELGRIGEVTDTGDSPDPNISPGLFYGPRGIAIADGELYVTDTGNERVQVFASDGAFLRAFGGYGTEPGKLIEPVGIAIGTDGLVYVADTGNSRISVFAKDGTPVNQIPVPNWEGQFSEQNYLRFGPNGVLVITSPGSGIVQAYNGSEFVTIQGGEAGGGLTAPLGIAIGGDGQALVTETSRSRVHEFPIVLPDGFIDGPVASPEATPMPTNPATPVG